MGLTGSVALHLLFTFFGGAIVWLTVVASSAQPIAKVPTEDDLNPSHAHVEVFLDMFTRSGEAPHIALYTTPDMKGPPAVELTGDGLFVHGQLQCSWPGGRFDGSNARRHLMVLGYADENASDFRGCPDLPIRSFWSYDDGRDPRLFVEVGSRRGSRVSIRRGGTTFYLDLNALPGDPALRGEPIDAALSRVIRRKGFTGWAWIEPRRSSESRAATAVVRRRHDAALTAFLRDVRACVVSESRPSCLGRFVKSQFYYPDLWDATRRPSATPYEFAQFLW